MWPALRPVYETLQLTDGRRVTVRPVTATDRDDIQAFVRSLEPETRRRSYFLAIRELSAPMLDAITRPDPAREKVLVAVTGDDAQPRMVALAQYAAADPEEDCEIALVLADDTQGQGLGTRMMARLLDAAKVGGFRRAVGDVLRNNRAMISLARRAGFEVAVNAEDPDLVRIVRPLDERSRAVRPRVAELVQRGVDSLRSLASRPQGTRSSGFEPA